jgi:hypothetical protein
VKPAPDPLRLLEQWDVRVGAGMRRAERYEAARHARPNDGEVQVSRSSRHDRAVSRSGRRNVPGLNARRPVPDRSYHKNCRNVSAL